MEKNTANIIVFDIGSTFTKAAAFHLCGEELRFLDRGQARTTLKDIMAGVKRAEAVLSVKGIELAPDVHRYSSCSAAGGLRMVALGYMPRVTAKAAKEVAMTAGARVMEVLSAEEPADYRREVLREICPDIILLAGGTDSGDETSVLENVDIICSVRGKAAVIIACNKYAQQEAASRLNACRISHIRVPNIMPTIHELHVKPARTAIHEQFINQITRADGLREFRETLTDKTVVPTPGAVLLACELLAKGTGTQTGIGSLIVIDVGGATTDIHSAIPELEDLPIEERGLVISNEKQFSYRTVEGNLGLRASATGIVETVGSKIVLSALDMSLPVTERQVAEYAERLETDTSHIPSNETEASLDRALTTCAVDAALRRHAGFYAKKADPLMGIMAGTAIGRDLRNVSRVICVGGVFAYCDKAKRTEMIARCFRKPGTSLLPLKEPRLLFDNDYIFYALGMICKHYPDAVIRFAKRHYLTAEEAV